MHSIKTEYNLNLWACWLLYLCSFIDVSQERSRHSPHVRFSRTFVIRIIRSFQLGKTAIPKWLNVLDFISTKKAMKFIKFSYAQNVFLKSHFYSNRFGCFRQWHKTWMNLMNQNVDIAIKWMKMKSNFCSCN